MTLEVGQYKTVNMTLTPGDVKQSVTVTAEASLVTTDRADRGTVVENQFVNSIPLLTRNPLLLVTMTAGAIGTATPGSGLSSGDNTVSQNQTNFFRINGGRNRSSEIMIDGARVTPVTPDNSPAEDRLLGAVAIVAAPTFAAPRIA